MNLILELEVETAKGFKTERAIYVLEELEAAGLGDTLAEIVRTMKRDMDTIKAHDQFTVVK